MLLLCMFSLPFFSLTAQNNYEIRKIKFSGNKKFSKSDLLDNMSFQQTNFIKQKIQKKDPSLYSNEMMEVDIERLTRFYQSEGYLNAEVWLDSLAVDDKQKRVNIYIKIKENKPVEIDSVNIHITDTLTTVKNMRNFNRRLYRAIDLKKGKRFVDRTLYKDITSINTIFSNFSYVYAATEYELGLDLDDNTTSIDYTVDPGPVCFFGESTVSGNRYVKEKYIRRQFSYKEGDRYSQTKLDKTRQQLYYLQLFRIVSISPETDKQTEKNPIPIHYQIQEMPRWMSKFGVGWGTEDKFRAFADVTYRGLFGGTSRLNLYAKHSALKPYNFSLSWIEPEFFLKKLSLTVNPYFRRESEPAYDIRRIGLNIPVGYIITDKLRVSVAYYLERIKQFDAEHEDPSSGYLDPENKEYLYNKSGLSASLSFTNATPVISPVRGATVTLGAKINGYIFGSDFNYTKLWLDARKYQRVGRFTLAGRAMIGGIHTSGSNNFVPVEDRFYSGGSNSNRGWRRFMLGPTTQTTTDDKITTTPEGGKSIIEMNFEVRHPLFWQIELAAFLDVGNVWTQSYHYRFNELSYAAGGGVRISTPIGPVRVDVGVPLNSEHDRKVCFFISVGQAF